MCDNRQGVEMVKSSATESKQHSKLLRGGSSSSCSSHITVCPGSSASSSGSGLGLGLSSTSFTFDGLGDFQLDNVGGMDQLEMSELLDTLQSQDSGTAAAAAALMAAADLSDCMSLDPASLDLTGLAGTGLPSSDAVNSDVFDMNQSAAAAAALNGE